MTTQLRLVSNIHTAFEDLILQVGEAKSCNPFAPITMLLPTARVIQDLGEKLGDTLGLYMYQFYRLGQAVLDEAGASIQEIQDTAIRRLLRSILLQLQAEGELSSFAAVHEKPGFIEVLLAWVREMKSQGITPEQYADYASQSENERDQQLAKIYVRYQDFMQQHSYSDADGLLWVAAEALEQNPDLFFGAGPLYVLGFDQFTPVQMRILQQLQRRFSVLVIYLQWDAARPDNDPVLARLVQTRDSILKALACQVKTIPESEPQVPLLAYLQRNLFGVGQAEAHNLDAVQMIAAPSREVEVRSAVREVKRLLMAGVAPQDIAILAPDPALYLPLLRSIAAEYGVPVEHEIPLAANPVVAALVKLLQLSPDFPWQAALDCLRSPYIRQTWLSAEKIDYLDQLSRERLVISGREQWSVALAPSETSLREMDEDDGKPALASQLAADFLGSVQAGLDAFFDHLTPPRSASYRDYTAWIQTALLGLFPDEEPPTQADLVAPCTLDILACSCAGPYPERDLQALALLMNALRKLLMAAEIAPGPKTATWEIYRSELIEIIHPMQTPASVNQLQVRFGRLEEGRARAVKNLFVLGLSEGEFPTPPAVDVLYSPQERERHALPLICYTTADEASLWWQALGNVRQRLTLLRPYIDDNGAPWQASPYWDAVRERFSDLQVETLPIADHPGVEQAASAQELLTVLAASGRQEVPDEFAELWSYAQAAHAIMQQRQSYLPAGEFEGILAAPDVHMEIARRYDDSHTWSASRLNRYANCPYGFFAEQVLKLSAREEPQDGLNAMQRGSLLHAVLEHLYRDLTAKQLCLTTVDQDEILKRLELSCKAIFSTAPVKFGFRAGAMWAYEQQELQRLMGALVSWECEQNGDQAAYRPYLQEAVFGFPNSAPALEIQVEDKKLKLHGFIDRIDQDADGNLRVIDYKSGSTTYSKNDIEKGLALQTALYALAAERNWLAPGAQVKESYYLHIPSREASGRIGFNERVQENEWVAAAMEMVARNVQQVRMGVFPSAPGKPGSRDSLCRENCDYAAICRVSRESIRKARQAGLA